MKSNSNTFIPDAGTAVQKHDLMSINWVSSLDVGSTLSLMKLEKSMVDFYQNSNTYYDNIDFTAVAWRSDPNYRKLARCLLNRSRVLEVGCGRANILTAYPDLACRYTGCDFSPVLVDKNKDTFPHADFTVLRVPNKLPFVSASFDAVFSTFVLEHCVFPVRLLGELVRVAAPGGVIVIICPDFLGRNGIPSQRAGMSPGTGREKLRNGKIWDAFLTGFDRKVRIPLRAAVCRREADEGRGFWINLEPSCFTDPFIADYDAVHLTYKPEILAFLRTQRVEILDSRSENRNQIFVVGRKYD